MAESQKSLCPGVGATMTDMESSSISNGPFRPAPRPHLALTLAACLAVGLAACTSNPNDGLTASVVSGRPDMVTGGDALILVSGTGNQPVKLTVNGQPPSEPFRAASEGGSAVGLVRNLAEGTNSVVVEAGDRSARLDLVNHPITGPVFSGPHQEPFTCLTERAGLGTPLDEDCSAETRTTYFYRSTQPVGRQEPRDRRAAAVPPGFKPLELASPRPEDVATTVTTLGREVPFIVRVETGTINRAIYHIATLHDPAGEPPAPWTRNDGWNGRLVYRFGGGCRAGYHQGQARPPLQDASTLAQGYAVAASSLNVFGNNCNDVLSAETMMMVKEHFIERYGVPVHTIGVGGSGGSMQQHLIAQNYPGLLDGIIPGASYPDPITLAGPVSDCSLLESAISRSSHSWSEEQKRAVSGYATWQTCESWLRTYSPAMLRPGSCSPAVPSDAVYDPERRPDGVRCGFHDNMVNLIGRDPETGIARRTLDNVGVQYGLQAFQGGVIDAEQFLELNQLVGGFDRDANLVPERTTADETALATAYRTGRVNSGGGSLGSIPIIDTRRYQDPSGNIHDRVRTFVAGARLAKANGTVGNRVAITAPPTSLDTVRLMDEWLTAIDEDDSADRSAAAVERNRPAALSSSCWSAEGERIEDSLAYGGPGGCSELYPPSGDPRIAAGAPITNDILKCQLKPVDPEDYDDQLTDDQVERLRRTFPDGVCDYSKPGVGQGALQGTWLRY